MGGLLLSIEAIKIKNVLRLRDTLFASLAGRATSPPVVLVDEHGQELPRDRQMQDPNTVPEWRHRRGCLSLSFPPFYWGWHLGIPILFWFLVEIGVRRATSFSFFDAWLNIWWPLKVLWVLGLLVSLVPLFFVLGCGAHKLLRWLALTCIDELDRLEARTQSGVIGVSGFLLMVVGVACQVVGTVVGG